MPLTTLARTGEGYTPNDYTLVEKYHGCVIKTYNQSVQIMSDIWGTGLYALVWDTEKERPLRVLVQVYDGPHDSRYPLCTATVDATEEVLEKYHLFMIEAETDKRAADELRRAKQIEKGCQVKVIAGRNGRGIEGKVVVVYLATYNMGWKTSYENKLAIATSDVMEDALGKNGKLYKRHKDTIWVWQRNCERTDVVQPDRNAIRAEVESHYDQWAKTSTWF